MNKNKFYSFNIYLLSAYCVIGNINFQALHHIPMLPSIHHTWKPYIYPLFATLRTCPAVNTCTNACIHICVWNQQTTGQKSIRLCFHCLCLRYDSAICRRHCHSHTYILLKHQAFQIQPLLLNIMKRAVTSQQSLFLANKL